MISDLLGFLVMCQHLYEHSIKEIRNRIVRRTIRCNLELVEASSICSVSGEAFRLRFRDAVSSDVLAFAFFDAEALPDRGRLQRPPSQQRSDIL